MTDGFADRFGHAAEVHVDAPGRVNLLGDHTDYNDGLALPTAIPQRTACSLAARSDGRVRVCSEAFDGVHELVVGRRAEPTVWSDYVAGVVWALRERGIAVPGFELLIASDVPLGGGLSSSAALEVACLRALRERFALEVDDLAIAHLAHHGESGYVGVPVGMLDPLACSLADVHTALLVDFRDLGITRIALPEAMELVVIDSGVAHDHASGAYRVRRRECELAAATLGLASLRDAALTDVWRLPAPLDRRARHVIRENQRVREAAALLRDGDVEAFGALLFASHASLRDDYESSVPEVDAIVARAAALPDVLGARITGGGWGGAVVACVRPGRARAVADRIVSGRGRLLVPTPWPA